MRRLHLICNSHIDTIWQWTWDEGVAAAISTFQSAADLAEEFDYIFCHGESLLYEVIEKNAPELFARITRLVKEGKWAITGGTYLQPDCNIPSGEGFVRQIKEGQAYFKEKFGFVPTVATNYDSFGHSLGLVQIMKKCGYNGYIICRPKPNVQFNFPSRFFKWTGPDGSSIVVSNGGSYNSQMGKSVEKIQKVVDGICVGMLGSEDVGSNKQEIEEVDFVLWGVGNHGGGPSRKDLKDIENYRPKYVEIFHSTPERLFADDINVKGEVKESLENCMPGCFSSMARIKKAYRDAENLYFGTEKMLAAAKMQGYNPDLTDYATAEKKILLAQFHDILPGTVIPDGEKDGLELLSMANKIIKDYRTSAFLYLAMQTGKAKEGEYPVCVFNYMPYELNTPIEVELMLADQNWSNDIVYTPHVFLDGKEVACQQVKEDSTLNLDWRKRIVFKGPLKPLAITRFSVYFEAEEKENKVIEQKGLDYYLDKNSSLLRDRVKLELYDDTADPWGMSDKELIELGSNPKEFSLMTKKQAADFCGFEKDIEPIHTIEDGEIYTAVEACYTAGKTNAVLEYKFYKNQPFIDLKLTVEYADKNKLLRIKIPAPNGKLFGDGPYIIEEKAKNEVTFQKWLGVRKQNGETFAVINDGVYSGKGGDGYVYLTLLRGAGYCFHPIESRELFPKDRYLPRIENGRYVYQMRIITGTQNEVSAEAELFNQKPYAINIFPSSFKENKKFIEVDSKVIMPMLKISKEGGYVARFYNPESNVKTFKLTVEAKEHTVEIFPHEVLSVIFKNGELSFIRDEMPI